jgi:Bifunctional DNA primase/polymerase, N-terminal
MAKSKRQRDHRQHEGQGKHKASPKRGNTTLALQYAQEGVPVVPLHGIKDGHCTCGDDYCDRSGKHPRTKRGIKDATTDPAEIERLWAKRPNAKIGIVMGGPGKVVALRTEGQTGRQSLRAITVRNGKLQETVTFAITIGGFISSGFTRTSPAVARSPTAFEFSATATSLSHRQAWIPPESVVLRRGVRSVRSILPERPTG